ncbi:MAG: hypothetical protein ACR2N7_06795 [Acidimicrobiia bacterium]
MRRALTPIKGELGLIVGVALLLATAACSSSDAEDIHGVWLTPDNANFLFINEDDTWSFSHHADPADVRAFGTFTFDGQLLTFSTNPASKRCTTVDLPGLAVDATGIYEASITSEGNLELEDVEDPCGKRKLEFRGAKDSFDQEHQRGTLAPYSP